MMQGIKQTGGHLWYWLNPKQILGFIQAIDQEAERERKRVADEVLLKRAWIVIAVSCVCLLAVHYLKYSNNLNTVIPAFQQLFSIDNNDWLRAYRYSEYRDLWGYLWWGSWHYLFFLLVPMLTIKLVLKQNLSEYGWQWGSVHKHWLGYVLLTTPILLFAFLVSFREDFANHYPFYKFAHFSWFDLIAWECIYILQFVAVEFFFRGFLVNGLRVKFGSLSVAVMCLPYLMLHFPKLWLESTGAILFGFFLGILALRSKSIWGGVGVHVAIALMMDMAALAQTKGFPEQWMR